MLYGYAIGGTRTHEIDTTAVAGTRITCYATGATGLYHPLIRVSYTSTWYQVHHEQCDRTTTTEIIQSTSGLVRAGFVEECN